MENPLVDSRLSVCSECGKLIVGIPRRMAFTSYTVGWTSSAGDRSQDFIFHDGCYADGKARLMAALRHYRMNAEAQGLGAGNAWVQLDPGDPESFRHPEGRVSSAAVSATGTEDFTDSLRGLGRTLAEGWRALPKVVRWAIEAAALVAASLLFDFLRGK
jgi:hypothetical protein